MISSKQCYECFEALLFNIWGLNTERHFEARNICNIVTATFIRQENPQIGNRIFAEWKRTRYKSKGNLQRARSWSSNNFPTTRDWKDWSWDNVEISHKWKRLKNLTHTPNNNENSKVTLHVYFFAYIRHESH